MPATNDEILFVKAMGKLGWLIRSQEAYEKASSEAVCAGHLIEQLSALRSETKAQINRCYEILESLPESARSYWDEAL